jgi:hypothetical protein
MERIMKKMEPRESGGSQEIAKIGGHAALCPLQHSPWYTTFPARQITTALEQVSNQGRTKQ